MSQQEPLAIEPQEADLPCQDHTCTAVIEDLVELTDESAWDEAE